MELVASLRGDSRTWAETGRLLGSVELHGMWREEAGSFTEWLKQFAVRIGKKESSLWRYLTAGRYYIELRKQMLARNIQCPTLQNLPDRISPENLELLSKLERAAPPDVIQDLSERVVAGVATRAELRDAWIIFRPILAGQTARGRLTPPRFDPADLSQRHSLMEATIFRALSDKNETWLDHSQSDFYELFTHLALPLHNQRKRVIVFDAVVATGRKSNGQLIFHGIEVVGANVQGISAEVEMLMKYCDFMWVATHEKFLDGLRASIPQGTGILVINDAGSIQVVLPAGRGSESGVNSFELAKMLLLNTLTR